MPHDWVVGLPFEREASHSHGYKTVGFRYPETSVGWYRKTFEIPREGEEIDIWAFSNCDEVELIANGKRLGRKPMPENGHLSWTAVYQPGRVKAVGYKNGKKILEKTIETTGEPSCIKLSPDRGVIAADGKDVSVITVEILDSKERFVPDADIRIDVVIKGNGRIIGFGNGDPARPKSI